MSARVDKQWKDKGLGGYSTEAILGTLGHYGVAYDEAGFKAAAAEKFPLELAMDWKSKWKGTGQFATFPYTAANELYTRLLPDSPTPMKGATQLIELIAHALHLAKLVGPEHVVLGSDLGAPITRALPGGSCPNGVRGDWDLPAVFAGLEARGFPREALDGSADRFLSMLEHFQSRRSAR